MRHTEKSFSQQIKLKTRQEIAYELGISRKTLYLRLKKNKINISNGLLSPIEQEKVYLAMGVKKP